MQHPAVPELAHTTPRPVHWLATATALAAVVAGSSFLQPDHATAAQAGPPAATRTTAPDPKNVEYPLQCGVTAPQIQKHATGDLDGDQNPETVAVVRCASGSGTPPSGVYVIANPTEGNPRVVATLVDPKDRLSVTDFAVRDGAVTATLLGYSSPDVPSCCPDTQDKAKWQWQNGSFVRSEQPDEPAAKSV
ncbi:hypothetical protein RCO28_11335 [Streptomyces sp. LHD-70]|uniref:hypothetical protein n=1 Tax=Streptomyces sp. LHD-70 TaxID=3072140 RepID=UPI00280E04EA|nr:hypothetical protein [Streptomyces sp. LHD-70]MDQ8703078.1 hypothetical protein [Streptomyces sp. LHD-70]